MKFQYYSLVFALLACSCSSSVKVLKPYGEAADIEAYVDKPPHNNSYEIGSLRGELLALSDSCLYVSQEEVIGFIPLDMLDNVHVRDYGDFGVSKGVLIFPLILEGLAAGLAFNYGEPGWAVASLFAAGVTIYGMAAGNPKVNFSFPLTDKDVLTFHAYCRYPQGLTPDQWRDLLQRHGQTQLAQIVPTQSP